MPRLKRLLFSEEGDLQEPARVGLWVVGFTLTGVAALWLLSRGSVNGHLLAPPPPAPPPVPALVSSAGTFGGGRRLYNLLVEASLSPQEAQSVSTALASVLPPRQLRAEDRYEILQSTSGAFRRLSVRRGFEQAVVEPGPEGLAARLEPVPMRVAERLASGTVTDSLWHAMTAQGLTPNLIDGLANQVFAWAIDFNVEVRAGDRFALLWREEKSEDGALVRDTILGALYEGRATGRQVAVRFMDDYFDAEGASLRRAFLHAPLAFQRISSSFNRRRLHPILRVYRPHHGTDYAAPTGTPVRAIGDGTVIFKAWSGGYGKLIRIRHNGTYTSYYGHLSRFRDLKVGQRVSQGQTIGYVGSTGLSTGPHLHFEMRVNGRSVNFLKLKPPSVGRIPEPRRPAFLEKRDRILKQLEGAGPGFAAGANAGQS